MPLFPGQESPPPKKIILYIVLVIVVLVLAGYLFPGGTPFQKP